MLLKDVVGIIRSTRPTDKYRENWERIFGKKFSEVQKQFEDYTHSEPINEQPKEKEPSSKD